MKRDKHDPGPVPNPVRSRVLLACALAAIAQGCAAPPHPSDWATVREVTPPFLSTMNAADPALAADPHGRVALTFVTRDSTGKDVWLSISSDGGFSFSEPTRINPRRGSVASYPEGRPSAAFGSGGELAVAWADRRAGSGAVDLMIRASADGGATLDAPVVVNDDTSASDRPAYHGFPALTFLPDGALFAAWLDERDVAGPGGEPKFSSMYGARSADGGQTWSANARLADSVCACCRPVTMSDSLGRVAVAFRNAAWDLRDPALAVSGDGGRTFEMRTVISPDGWLLEGCPDQGPALTWNRDGGGHYAWFTGAGRSGVYLVPWQAGHGAAGLKRLLADSLIDARSPRLAPLGRSTLIAVEGRAKDDSTRTVLAVRALDEDGSVTPWIFLGADVESGWLCGLDASAALACWVEHQDEGRRVRLAKLTRK